MVLQFVPLPLGMGLIGAYICLTLVWLLRRRTLITNRDQPSSMLFKSRSIRE
jgi:hypothetical protein